MHSVKLAARRTLMILPMTLFVGLLWSGCSYSGTTAQLGIGVEVGSGTSEFSALAGYGEWADVSPYGQVWRPYVVDGWQPFSDGYWAWTSAGWTWVSYEPYGWLVYHYGDWDYDPDFGWFWIPGTTWSPARVRWYSYGGYVGWAPIGPRGTRWAPPWEGARFNAWVFVPLRDFDRDDVGHYRMAEPPRGRRPYDHRSYFHAPRFNRIRGASHGPVPQFHLQREPVHMGGHDYSRIVLPPREKQRVEQHRPEFRQHEAPPQTLRPVPEHRRHETRQPPNVNRGGRNQNNHAGGQNRGERGNNSGQRGNHQARERGREIPRFNGQNREQQQHQGQRQENPRYRGREHQGQRQENPRYRGREQQSQPERGHDRGRNRHYDPHREHQRQEHQRSEHQKPEHRKDGKLL